LSNSRKFWSGRFSLPIADRRTGVAEVDQPLDIVVTGILITPTTRIMLFTDGKGQRTQRVRVGEVVQGWKVVKIEPHSVKFQRDKDERILKPKIETTLTAKPKSNNISTPQPAQPQPAGSPEDAILD
jgi:type II secretory pathway component PulC